MALAAPFHVPPSGKRAVYYHTSWSGYDRDFQVRDLPIDKITDIAYAFFNVASDGTAATGDAWADFQNPLVGKGVEPQNAWDSPARDLGNFGQFMKLRRAGHKFNMALSLGGWTWSAKFSDAVSTAANRARLCASVLATVKQWPGLFNGVSIDWEYVTDDGKNYGADGNVARPADAKNLVLLIRELRKALGAGFRVSMCVTAAPEKIKLSSAIKDLEAALDEVHIMTYDFMDGAWGLTTAGHHTNLRRAPYCVYSVEDSVATWVKLVPAHKLFIGVALYSRGFAKTDGIGKPASGPSPDKSWDSGSVDFKKLPLAGAVEVWDPVARASYSYDAKRRVLNSYDCPRSVAEKCDFVFEHGLGGVIVWESSGDHAYSHARSIMKVLHDKLTHAAPKPAPGPKPAEPTKPEPAEPTKPGQPVPVDPEQCACACQADFPGFRVLTVQTGKTVVRATFGKGTARYILDYQLASPDLPRVKVGATATLRVNSNNIVTAVVWA